MVSKIIITPVEIGAPDNKGVAPVSSHLLEVKTENVVPLRGEDYPVLAKIWENDADDIFDDDAHALPSG